MVHYRDFSCFLMIRKSAKKNITAITAEIRLIISQACQTGMKVLRYFSEPIIKNIEAVPINEIPRAKKIRVIMLVIKSFCKRFLRTFCVSCMYSLRIDFASLSNP